MSRPPRRVDRPTALFARHAVPAAPRRPLPPRALLSLLLILPLLVGTVLVTARARGANAAVAPVGAPGTWQLAFADEFDGGSLDTGKWQTAYPWGAHWNEGNSELQYFAASACREGNGTLAETATRQAQGGQPYTACLISSYASFAPTYGFFEERAKLPRGKGYWPAFWLSPEDYSQWPPEIDILEAAGDEPNTISMTYHYKDSSGAAQQVAKDFTGPDFTADYHVFGLAWTPTTLTWYIDGVARFSTPTRGAQVPMYLMANLAIDGGNAPDGSTPFPGVYDIDYIRAWTASGAAMSNPSPSPSPKPSPTPTPTPSPSAAPSPLPAPSASPKPSPAPSPAPVSPAGAIRVVAGGGAYADSAGNTWAADAGYNGGIDTDFGAVAVAGTADPGLYRHERWGTFGYTFAVPDGAYAVTLKFAENYWTRPGQRVFNVAINGQPVLTNFDILTQVPPDTALDKTFRVTAAGGSGVKLAFTGIVDDAKISAIQIAPAGAASPSPAPSPSPKPAPAPSPSASPKPSPAPSASPSPKPATSPSPSPSATPKPSPSPSPSPRPKRQPKPAPKPASAFAPVRVAAGGDAYTDHAGNRWAADSGYSGGITTDFDAPVAGTADPGLYRHERWGTFRYAFAAPDGEYAVTLRFAENYWTKPSQRVFNVAINGQTVLKHFDILEQVAPKTALDKTFRVTATGGHGVTIAFAGVVDDATISAIQITPAGAAGASPAASPGAALAVAQPAAPAGRRDDERIVAA